MKRRSPLILAAISLLGIAALAYQSSQQQEASRQHLPLKVTNSPNGTVKIPDTKLSAAETSTAPMPSPTSRPVTKTSFHLMPDGSPVPALPESAPEKVKLGVVLFRYKGAQGAAASTRSKDQALVLANQAHAIAKEDFAAAVKQGDRGSQENIGWIARRILENSVEYAVFSLDKGQLSKEPLDTPRGLWVVKRIR